MQLATNAQKKISVLAADNPAPVAILGKKSALCIGVALGALFSGRAFCFFDPVEKSQRVRNRISCLGPSAVIDIDGYFGHLIQSLPFPNVSLAEGQPEMTEHSIVFEPNRIAYVMFTSGSTGEPRGITVGHRAAVLARERYLNCTHLSETDNIVSDIPLIFDVSTLDVMGGLASGACVNLATIAETESEHLLHEKFLSTRSASAFTVPTVADLMFSKNRGLPYLRTLLLTGELIGERLARRLESLRVNTINAYGMTEAPWVTTGRLTDGRNLLDIPSTSDPVSISIAEDGEIVLSGEGLFSGYATQSFDYTRDPGPVSEYRTGDYGTLLSDGKLQFLGRRDRHIRYDGYRIELGEIESLIEQASHDVLAYASYDPISKLISVGIAPSNPDAAVDLPMVQRRSQESIPYFMFPKDWRILNVAPRTVTGKKSHRSAYEGA